MWTERPTRWPMTFGLAAGALLAVAWNQRPTESEPKAPPAEEVSSTEVSDRGMPGVVVHHETREYILSAKTVEGLERQLRRAGFRSAHQHQGWSQTDGLLTIEWEAAQGWTCSEKPRVRLDLTTQLPRTGDVSQDLALAFEPFRTALERHEDEHARQWQHAARSLADELSTLSRENCVRVRREAREANTRWNTQAAHAGKALDIETRDGTKTGVVLDVEAELQFVHFPRALVAPIEQASVSWPSLGGIESQALSATETESWTACLQSTEVSALHDTTALPHAMLTVQTQAGTRQLGVFLDGTVHRKGRTWHAECVSRLIREQSKRVGKR